MPQGGRRALDSPGPAVRRLTLLLCRKKANFMRKILAKDSPQSELQISGYKRNGARAELESAETERDRETDPISEGLSPLPRHGDHGPEGKPFPSREKVKEEEGGGLSPPRFRWRRNVVGGHHHHHDRSTPTPPPSSPTSPSPSPLYLQRSTLPQPVVPST